MKYNLVLILALFYSELNVVGAIDETGKKQDTPVKIEAEKEVFLRILIERLSKSLISADAGWEFYSSLIDGELRDKLLIYINILAEIQKIDPKHPGYRMGVKGVFIHDCSKVLSVPSETIMGNFSQRKGNDNNEDIVIIDARKLFLGIHNRDLDIAK